MTFHRISLIILYLVTLILVGYVLAVGHEYYSLPLALRPHHALHEAWKPAGVVGHGLGIFGSLLMLLLLVYSARKRLRVMQRMGNIRYWLNYHIWMGVTGPLLVILHTTFKVGGIVSVSFWSMVAVALSGVLGRYVYIQIPRAMTGEELSDREIEQMDQNFTAGLRERYRIGDEVMALLDAVVGNGSGKRIVGLLGVAGWIGNDLTLPIRLRSFRRAMSEFAPRSEIGGIMKLVRRMVKLRRRRAFLDSAQTILHHWHVVHKPFAAVMLTIMMIHVVVTVVFGCRWIF